MRLFKGSQDKTNFLVFISLIVIFIITKFPFLNYPFYWDEAWVYAPALQTMAEGSPSLLPGVISQDLTRGHPLLFHFLGGLWIKAFGNSNMLMHSFALLISLGYLGGIYALTKSIFTSKTALIAVFFMMFQPIFFFQSTFLLPEVLLGLFGLLSLYFFLQKRFLPFVFALAFMLLIKESALVFWLAFLVIGFSCLFVNKQHFTRAYAKYFWATLLAIIPYVLFLLYQKSTAGWYFFPDHTSLIQLDLKFLVLKFKAALHDFFSNEKKGTFLLTALGLGGLVFSFLKKNKPTIQNFNTILFVSTFVCVAMIRSALDSFHLVLLGLTLLAISGLLLVQHIFDQESISESKKMLVALLLLVLPGFLLFSSMNFYSYRYLLAICPYLSIIAAWALCTLIDWKAFISAPVILAFLFITYQQLVLKRGFGDCEAGYIDMVRVHQKIVAFTKENIPKEAGISTNFLINTALSNPKAGYIKDPYQNFIWDQNFKYFLFDNNGNEAQKERWLKEVKLELIYEVQFHDAKGEVWQRVL